MFIKNYTQKLIYFKKDFFAFIILCLIIISASIIYNINNNRNKTANKSVSIKVQHEFMPEKKSKDENIINKKNNLRADLDKKPELKQKIQKKQVRDLAEKPEKDNTIANHRSSDAQIKQLKALNKKSNIKKESGISKNKNKNKNKKNNNNNNNIEKTKKHKIKEAKNSVLNDKKLSFNYNSEILKKSKNNKKITLSKNLYKKIHDAWMDSGNKGDSQIISLRVSNLKNVYQYFRMKPVAVLNNKFVDLCDNLMLSSDSLKEYSETVFISSDPWNDWGDRLIESGFKKQDNVIVRYYMYNFIRNSIYQIANKAFQCSKDDGLISKSVLKDHVDILGETFVIERDGNGKFGIFVPRQIDLAQGKTININPSCFSDQEEIQILITSGIIN